MNVLIGSALKEGGTGRLASNRVERVHDLRPLLRAQNAHPFQRPCERLRSPNIRIDQPPVEVQRSGEALEDLGRPRLEAPAPEFHFRSPAPGPWPPAPAASARTFIGSPIRLMKPSASFWS